MMPSFDDSDGASPAVASSETQPSPPKPTVVEEETAKSNSKEGIQKEHEPEPVHKQQPPPPSTSTSTTSSDNGEDGGLWGLTSAFGGASGWGLGGGAAETTSASSSSSAAAAAITGEHRQTGATDVELAELENSIAAAETAVSTAIWSTFAAVSSAVGGATTSGEANPKKDSNAPLTDEDLDAILTGESPKGNEEATKPETPEAAAAASNPNTTTTATTEESQAPAPSPIPGTTSTSTSIWSSLGAAVSETLIATNASTEEGENEDGVNNQAATATATASSTLYNLYTSNVNRAAEWIEDLERAQSDNDPYKRLKGHLNTYLTAHPRGNYEEWVENYLGEQGWDASDHHPQSNAAHVVVDSSYYTEECPHRILWNEKCYQDGIQIDDENPSRAYVPTPSTKEDRRHRTSVNDDEEIITFDANNNDDDKSNSTPNNADDGDVGPQAAAAAPPASPPAEQQQQPLFKDDASLVMVQKPSPVLSCSTLDTRSDDGSGILVSKTTSTMLRTPQEYE